MPYIKVSKLTFVDQSFYEPSIKFFYEDFVFVKSENDKLRQNAEGKLHSFELRNAIYRLDGDIVQAVVLTGLDKKENKMVLEGDLAVCGCPPGREPLKEIPADDKKEIS